MSPDLDYSEELDLPNCPGWKSRVQLAAEITSNNPKTTNKIFFIPFYDTILFLKVNFETTP